MTFEELKAEASRQGYTLTKKITYEKLKPCVCGSKRVRHSCVCKEGRVYYCVDCGRHGKSAKYLYQARANWNKAVEQVKNIDGWKGE